MRSFRFAASIVAIALTAAAALSACSPTPPTTPVTPTVLVSVKAFDAGTATALLQRRSAFPAEFAIAPLNDNNDDVSLYTSGCQTFFDNDRRQKNYDLYRAATILATAILTGKYDASKVQEPLRSVLLNNVSTIDNLGARRAAFFLQGNVLKPTVTFTLVVHPDGEQELTTPVGQSPILQSFSKVWRDDVSNRQNVCNGIRN